MRLHFLGANRQVTGSRYMVEAGGLRIMIDCGMFQERKFLGRNWETPIVDPKTLDFLLLTHAHLDHTGLIPRFVANGFSNPIIATEPTTDLTEIIMMDSAKIQKEDAEYKKKRHKKQGRKGKYPTVPLYTTEDSIAAVSLLRGVKYNEPVKLNDQVTAVFHEAGHILGSAHLELRVTENGSTKKVVFSGDVGQWDKPLIRDPSLLDAADYVVMESTYGDRNHKDAGDVATQLADAVNDVVERRGNLIIPTFAIERAQELIYHISQLVYEGRIPNIPVFLDSPMAVNVTDLFRKYRDYMDAKTHALFDSGQPPLRFPGLKLVRSVDESKAINDSNPPNIIMAASGMCTGGRIKHHLRANISRHDATILFVGYQAHGTLGRLILDGREEVRIHGREFTVRAKTAQIYGFSAHGDCDDLIRWLGHLKQPPKQVFLTHGEEDSALALAKAVKERLGWPISVPEYRDEVDLD